MKDCLQLADPLPQLFIFGVNGLQLITKLSLLLPDEGKLLELTLVLEALVALLLDRIGRVDRNEEQMVLTCENAFLWDWAKLSQYRNLVSKNKTKTLQNVLKDLIYV